MPTLTLNILDTAQPRCGKPSREDLKPGECLCDHCTAKCCRYFALAIDKPTTWRDFDHMRWFLLHDKASVFVEEGDWYLLVHTTCRHLQADNRCGIYRDPSQHLPRLHDGQVRVRGQLGLRPLLGNARTGCGIRRGGVGSAARREFSQPAACLADGMAEWKPAGYLTTGRCKVWGGSCRATPNADRQHCKPSF